MMCAARVNQLFFSCDFAFCQPNIKWAQVGEPRTVEGMRISLPYKESSFLDGFSTGFRAFSSVLSFFFFSFLVWSLLNVTIFLPPTPHFDFLITRHVGS